MILSIALGMLAVDLKVNLRLRVKFQTMESSSEGR
jgi:hypothetical protein